MENGFLLIFFLYAIAEVNDAFAYLWGSCFGKKKIFPNISPNKTYAGFFGGILTTLAFAMLLNHFITQFSLLYGFAAAMIIVIFTILGDLLSSKIKRAFDVKDFSHLIPKVGGILDAYDALIFASPVFFLFINFTKDKF